MVHRITELTKTERGTEAVIHLVPDHEDDGIVGDNMLDGHESELKSLDDQITLDQLRQAHKTTGRFNDQRTVINFREQARDQLSHWMADRSDQIGFLLMSGIDLGTTNKGAARKKQDGVNSLGALRFNPGNALHPGEVAGGGAPTSERHLQIKGDQVIEADSSKLEGTDTLGYVHIVQMQAIAKERYIKGIRGKGNSETFHLFVTPSCMAALKLDPDFIANARHAGVRGGSNTLWAGGDTYIVDGLAVHEFRHVYTNERAGAGNMWGADGNVAGSRALLCGAQALAFVDLGDGYWDERDHHDYGNTKGISYGRMFGMKKPQFSHNKNSVDRNAKQDYGVVAIDMAASFGGRAA
jgi:N4-gp56 family major capsid protein